MSATPPQPSCRHFAALIVGAGQAGLAAAHELVRRGLVPGEDFLVVDANTGPGGAWQHRWDSLTLGRAHGIADLPGLPLGDPPADVPAARIVADYYGRYEDAFDLRVHRPVTVTRVDSPQGRREGPLHVTLRDESRPGAAGADQALTADFILNATGTWTRPFIPYIPGRETFTGRQLHTHDYTRAEDFRGLRTLVVGGGLSAVQFLLELAPVTKTLWATRRPPNFLARAHDPEWGRAVEAGVTARIRAGLPAASVVRHTGIPLWPEYVEGVHDGTLVSHGMFNRITPHGVVFAGPTTNATAGLGPAGGRTALAQPRSWQPYPGGHTEDVDVIFWNTGFRPALDHLAPLHLRGPHGGIAIADEVTVDADPRIYLVGYGSAASTIGATRAGRLAGRAAARRLAPAGPGVESAHV